MEVIWNLVKPVLTNLLSKVLNNSPEKVKPAASAPINTFIFTMIDRGIKVSHLFQKKPKSKNNSFTVGNITLLPVTIGNVHTGGIFITTIVLSALVTALLALIIIYVENKSVMSTLIVSTAGVVLITYMCLKPKPRRALPRLRNMPIRRLESG